MRILWCSVTPRAPTGYGTQTAEAVRVLRSLGHEVSVLARGHKEEDPLFWEDEVSIIPSRDQYDPFRKKNVYANLALAAWALQPQLVIFLGDAWVTDTRPFQEFKALSPHIKLAVISPVDCSPLSPKDQPLLDLADYKLAMSLHAKEEIMKAGYRHDVWYIPHSVPGFFQPGEAPGKDPSLYVVGMVQANYGFRKLVPIQLEAMSLARRHIENLRLYMHMNVWGVKDWHQTMDYSALVRYFGLEDIALTMNPYEEPPSYSELPAIYRQLDLLLHTTAGEGFGMPIVEAMACGVPVVCTNNSAMQHFVGPLKVRASHRMWVRELESFHSYPDPESVAEVIVKAKNATPSQKFLQTAAGAWRSDYVAEHYWTPFLRSVVDDVTIGLS